MRIWAMSGGSGQNGVKFVKNVCFAGTRTITTNSEWVRRRWSWFRETVSVKTRTSTKDEAHVTSRSFHPSSLPSLLPLFVYFLADPWYFERDPFAITLHHRWKRVRQGSFGSCPAGNTKHTFCLVSASNLIWRARYDIARTNFVRFSEMDRTTSRGQTQLHVSIYGYAASDYGNWEIDNETGNNFLF